MFLRSSTPRISHIDSVLQPLHEIVRRDNVIVLAWAHGNPCHVEPLAEAVLEGLELWPYVIDLLRLFGTSPKPTPGSYVDFISAGAPAFRTAVLRSSPMLLDSLLQKAINSEQSDGKVASSKPNRTQAWIDGCEVCVYLYCLALCSDGDCHSPILHRTPWEIAGRGYP